MNQEPQSATDYDDRTSNAVRSVLVEIGQTLGSYRGKFAVIGGAVPWLLLEESDMKHVGTADIDLSLDAEALAADDQYVGLVEALREQGYAHVEDLKNFQMERTFDPGDGGAPITIVIDFLRPYDAVIEKNRPALTADFATQRAFGADLATRFYEMVALEGAMPGGGVNKVMIAVASIPALLAMKGHALDGRNKPKDGYDIYYSVRNYPDGIEALAEACKPLLHEQSAVDGYFKIAGKFRRPDDFGPTSVRRFVENSDILDDRSPDEWQQDAFGQVVAWLKAIGFDPQAG
ncbi:nucleotidyl transferase AbiEii/AbiGii toxin family protein (plasmid) [Sphingobium sp. SJ10-10]|uniref:Ync n=1 Tax=Sphingomonas sp. NS2 TaxID=908605 RepID=A0A0D4ZY43_9SPHN|nr:MULTISPECIES: nucleotidyl transferase AbiEii/AbiGii toxin family protein [unclassified Sphingobium]AJW29192.1 hypothetical protein plasmid201_004 [Sphingomonas sp. NS2]AMK26622.1 hypothetical protein K426_28635 [Sphingobium sp. TKS]MEC6699641.1 nucleotidyl transferase AbiEii/AbiGii toxin family protein [Sphingobium sp. SJ10-10]